MSFVNIFSFFDNLVTAISRIRTILLIVFLAWGIFVFNEILNIIKLPPLNTYYIPFTNFLTQLGWFTHLIGVFSGVLLLLSVYIPNKEIIKYLASVVKNRKTFDPEYIHENLFSEQQTQKHLMEFSKDANEVFLLAGSADFLNNNPEQIEEIKTYRSRCKLLLKPNYGIATEILKELISSDVQVRAYPDKTPLLRGRLKTTSSGKAALLFDKKGQLFHLLKIKNTTLLDILFNRFEDWFTRGRNPLIRHIIFDLGNMFLEGDFHSFLKNVETITGEKFNLKSDNYLCASEELNLGKINIIEYVETNVRYSLDENESRQIRKLWNNTWIMNDELNKLAWELNEKGYIISLFSNCDEENGDVYELKNYLDVFDYRFFSFDMKLLKPEEAFFYKMLERLEAKPYECIVIDDHKSNIDVAHSLGFHAIHVSRAIESQNKAEFITKQLKKLQIRMNGR